MIVLAGADIVLPDRVLPSGSLVLEGGRITAIEARAIDGPEGATRLDLQGALVVPGFVDVHLHGVEGIDVMDGAGAIAAVAARLPRYGVTSFCPTSIASAPDALDAMLSDLKAARAGASAQAARVLPAHLESNFINPEYKGAQPGTCLRTPGGSRATDGAFTGDEILAIIAAHRDQVAIVTMAPEIEGGLELVRRLTAAGHRVSIGHTGATYEEATAAIEAGVCHATHLFNRMSPLGHRAPGVPGAVLQSDAVAAEIICDTFHVHPALLTLAVRAKGPGAIMAISDGTAGSGLPVGARARIGGRTIIVTARTAELEDGTIAGSVSTLDQAFRVLVREVRVSPVEAARMCATTPAEQLRLKDTGRIVPGAIADLAVLDAALQVRTTIIGGEIFRNTSPPSHV